MWKCNGQRENEKLQEFSFHKILRSTVSRTKMTNWYKKRKKKEVLLSCQERGTKEKF